MFKFLLIQRLSQSIGYVLTTRNMLGIDVAILYRFPTEEIFDIKPFGLGE